VLLAHTLDDQAETVLLGLGRGSGPRAIQGMRPANGPLRRPFLSLRRAETERICRLHDLDWWQDPHNDDPAFRRVRVRRELLPLMEDVLGGGVAEALSRTADLVRMDADAVDGLATRAMPGSGGIEDLWTFADLAAPVRLRIWRRLAIDAGASAGELSHGHTLSLDGLLQARGGTRIELPGGVTAVREGDRVHFVARDL
uniref:ATP-binding protein n=1 Tax=Aeromicrobium sp. TaxID=1871063 RepID=UPI0028A6D0FB